MKKVFYFTICFLGIIMTAAAQCLPSFTNTCSNYTVWSSSTRTEDIFNVSLSTSVGGLVLNNSSNCGTTLTTANSVQGSYSNYVGSGIPIPDLCGTVSFSVTRSVCAANASCTQTTTALNWGLTIYVDYNNNSTFGDVATERVYNRTIAGATTTTYSAFAIPAGVTIGNVKMRVLCRYNLPVAGPCLTYGDGEAEDYMVNITATVCPVVTLPIELVNFTGECANDKTVLLKWSTATETNNHHFTIEKSADGINFEFVRDISSQGNSNQIQTYTYVDKDISNSLYYYRLKQTDNEGSFKYFNMISIEDCFETSDEVLSILNLYPNPAGDNYIKLDYFSNKIGVAVISFKNVLGQELKTQEVRLIKGNSSELIPISDLSAGVYFIQVISSDAKSKLFKLVRNK